jgi:hypothetical protein
MREWVVPALGTFIFWGLWGFLPKTDHTYDFTVECDRL